jgi:hypothetical protein
MKKHVLFSITLILFVYNLSAQVVSAWVQVDKDYKLTYYKDSLGNQIPDFSSVGYRYGKETFPKGKVVASYVPSGGDDTYRLQKLIDSVGNLPHTNLLKVIKLKKGTYTVSSTIYVRHSGLIIRGEGANENGTIINYTSTKQSDLFVIEGKGKRDLDESKEETVTDNYVPVGAKQLHIKDAAAFAVNDPIVIERIATDKWIHDIGMDDIKDLRDGGKNWEAGAFKFYFERIITGIDKATGLITINAPIVMPLDVNYGGGRIMPYTFKGRIEEVGMENLRLNSCYANETDEQHGWCAIKIDAAQNCWVQNVLSLHFGYSCVLIGSSSKNITVQNCVCLDPISIITGGRRYSFNCEGQLNLFRNCTARNGRHDFVTGARVCGPNVFVYCTATLTHADIGPHHRWAMGTLYDNITSDGAINAQDRGNLGTGHGWSGAYQVFWNCISATAAIQNPPMAYNWNIGYKGENKGAKLVRPNGVWEATNVDGVVPASLYIAQVVDWEVRK